MHGAEWGVLIGGVLLIAVINWWFFLAGRGTAGAGVDPRVRHDHHG